MFRFCHRFAKCSYKMQNGSKRFYSVLSNDISTIYALSSGKGKSGVAVVRISGPETSHIVRQLINQDNLPPARTATLRTIYDPADNDRIDKGLILWFPGPNSFTGEDVAELHVHGGIAVVKATLNALSRLPRTRQAEPGEFTKRAFINGKMDLTEAEGIADLVHAETDAQRRQAFRQMDGALSKKFSNWRERLLKARALLEAIIDFSEEEQLEPDMLGQVKDVVRAIEDEIVLCIHDHRRGERLRNGVHIAILGEPNVGKSSLLNAICQRPAAIVSPIAGTTRDVVETALDIGGYPVILSDTAGLRLTDDSIESEGIRRALSRASMSDLIVMVVDSSTLDLNSLPSQHSFTMNRLQFFDVSLSTDLRYMVLFNKIDLLSDQQVTVLKETFRTNCSFISCTADIGMTKFVDSLSAIIQDLCGDPLVGEASLTQQRHRSLLESCLERLKKFWLQLDCDDITLVTYEVQQALRCIGKITGHVYVEEVLDVIFRDFCIGK